MPGLFDADVVKYFCPRQRLWGKLRLPVCARANADWYESLYGINFVYKKHLLPFFLIGYCFLNFIKSAGLLHKNELQYRECGQWRYLAAADEKEVNLRQLEQ